MSAARAMRLPLLLPALLLVLGLTACSKPPPAPYQSRLLALGTLVNVSISGVEDDQAAHAMRAVEDELNQVYKTWHAWQPSILSDINRRLAAGEAVAADPATLAVLRKARDLNLRSGKLFEPGIGTLIKLWGFHSDDRPAGPPPSEAAIARLLAGHPSLADLIIEDQQLRSANPVLQIDLGGFAKGYAVDQAVERLRSLGIRNAIVNAGGDLRAIGSHGERPWRIGIRDPRGPGIIAALETHGDESVFTSGNYERYFDYQGVRYHHIIDPRSGRPARGVLSVTVIHNDAGTADAAATALFVAGPQGWRASARQMGIDQVMLIDSEMRIHVTPKMNRRLIFQSQPVPEVIVSPLS